MTTTYDLQAQLDSLMQDATRMHRDGVVHKAKCTLASALNDILQAEARVIAAAEALKSDAPAAPRAPADGYANNGYGQGPSFPPLRQTRQLTPEESGQTYHDPYPNPALREAMAR